MINSIKKINSLLFIGAISLTFNTANLYSHEIPNLNPQRFNLVAEYIYTHYSTHNINTDWHNQLYENFCNCTQIDKKNYSAFDLRACGMKEQYLDFMATEYAKAKKNTFVTILFPPSSHQPQKALDILAEFGNLVYTKALKVNNLGFKNVLDVLYEVHHCNGWPRTMQGVYGRYKHLLNKNSDHQLFIILWECESLQKAIECKRKIRAHYDNRQNTVCHFTDQPFEAVHASRAFFSDETLRFLNTTRPGEFPQFIHCIKKFQPILKKLPELANAYAIDAGAVLAAYNLRETGDLDIVTSYKEKIPFANLGINNVTRTKYGFNIDDLIYNPSNFFYHKGLRFLCLASVLAYKTKKGNEKDLKDVALIEQFLEQDAS